MSSTEKRASKVGAEEPELFAMIENYLKINSRENKNSETIYPSHGSNLHRNEQFVVNAAGMGQNYYPLASKQAATNSVAVALNTNSNHEFYTQQLPMVSHEKYMPPPGFENFDYRRTTMRSPLSDSINAKNGTSTTTLNVGHPKQSGMNPVPTAIVPNNNGCFYSQVPIQMNSNYGPMAPTLIFNPMLGRYESINQMHHHQLLPNNCPSPMATTPMTHQPACYNNDDMNPYHLATTRNYYPTLTMMNPNFLQQHHQSQQTMQNFCADQKNINHGDQYQQQKQKFSFYNRNNFRKHNPLFQKEGRRHNNKKNEFHHPHMKSGNLHKGKMYKSWSMDRALKKTDCDDIMPIPITFWVDGETQWKTPTLTLNAWSPFSQNMITGVQQITTRSYPLPDQCKNVPIGIVEIIPSASVNYRHPALVGEVIFSGDKKYFNQEEWEVDTEKHGNDVQHHYKRNKSRGTTPPKWGWIIKEFKTYDKKIMDISMDYVDHRINYVHNFFMWDYKMKANKTTEKVQN